VHFRIYEFANLPIYDDFVAKLGHVVEEADESVYWLELITAAKTSDDPDLPGLLAEANELLAIFNQSQLTARMNQATRRGTKASTARNRQLNSPNP